MEFPTHLKTSKSLSGRDCLGDASVSTAEESDEMESVEEIMTGLQKVSSRLKELTVLSTRDGNTKTTFEESESSFASMDDLDQRFEVMYNDYNDLNNSESASGGGSNQESLGTFTDFSFDETGSFCAPSKSLTKSILPQLLTGQVDPDNSEESDQAMVADSVAGRKSLERSMSMRVGASSRRDLLTRGSSSRRDLLMKQSTSYKNLVLSGSIHAPEPSRRDLLARGTSSRRDLLKKQSTSYKKLSLS